MRSSELGGDVLPHVLAERRDAPTRFNASTLQRFNASSLPLPLPAAGGLPNNGKAK